jgi:hypothetical protein
VATPTWIALPWLLPVRMSPVSMVPPLASASAVAAVAGLAAVPPAPPPKMPFPPLPPLAWLSVPAVGLGVGRAAVGAEVDAGPVGDRAAVHHHRPPAGADLDGVAAVVAGPDVAGADRAAVGVGVGRAAVARPGRRCPPAPPPKMPPPPCPAVGLVVVAAVRFGGGVAAVGAEVDAGVVETEPPLTTVAPPLAADPDVVPAVCRRC